MTLSSPQESDEGPLGGSPPRGTVRPLSLFLAALLALTQIPTASAHEGTGVLGLSHGDGILLIIGGMISVGGFLYCKRTDRLQPTNALYGFLFGLALIVAGIILFDGLSPDPTYTASSIPFPRSWYPIISLSAGLFIAITSFVLGWLRWPARPRYTFFGILMGFWISYPALIPGPASYTHPLGYALVLGTPIFVGYILWTDAWNVIRAVLRDRIARRFGIGVGSLVGLFFLSTSGYLTFFWEEGAPTETTIVVLPANYQLVKWPTLEIALPDVPFFLAISVGIATVVGLLSVLVGLNAALIARHWRVESGAGLTEGTAGTGAIVGSCTCGCCGPLVAKVAVLAAGPTIAAPIYWVFVDTASPLSSIFIIGSIVLFTGSLIYSVEAARRSDQSSSIVPAD